MHLALFCEGKPEGTLIREELSGVGWGGVGGSEALKFHVSHPEGINM